MSFDSKIPYAALDFLPSQNYHQVWKETVFRHGKLDPQIGDTVVLADFPIVLEKFAWQEISGLAEKLAAEAISIEAELLLRTDLHKALALPNEISKAWKDTAKVKSKYNARCAHHPL